MKFFGDLPFDEDGFVKLCCGAQLVKRNPVREVLRAGKFFIKHDLRKEKSFRQEYENAQFLMARGIPVVRHLGYAESDDGHYLVTETLENAVEVEDFSRRGKIDAAFCNAFCEFINFLRKKRLRHTDFHTGNILYVPENHSFSLVDVKDVKRGIFPFYSDRALQKPVMALRLYLPRETIYEMLGKVGVSHPARFFAGELRAEFRRVSKEWEKRKHQIMTGYPKFTRIDGHFILDRSADKSEIETARRYPVSTGEFLAYYFMQLIRIPTVRIVGFDLSCKELLLPPEREYAPADPARIADLRNRLLLCGIETREEDWRTDHAGHVVLTDWSIAARSLW